MSDEVDLYAWRMPEGPFTGGCQCGAVRFQADELFPNPHVCYCRMCQKATGNMFASLVGVRHEHLTWTRGTPSRFRSSDNVDRGFCANCGTPLFYQNLKGERVSLTIGAFDEPHRIELRWQMGMEGKHPSLLHLDDVESFGSTEEEEDPEDVAAIKESNGQHPDHDTAEWTPKPSTV